MSRVIAKTFFVICGVRVLACDRLFRCRVSSRFTFLINCYLIYVALKPWHYFYVLMYVRPG